MDANYGSGFLCQSECVLSLRLGLYAHLSKNDGFWEIENVKFGRLLELHVFHDFRLPKLRPIILRPKSSRENVLELIDPRSPDSSRSSENFCGFL